MCSVQCVKCVVFVYVGYVYFAYGFVSVVCFGCVIAIFMSLCLSGSLRGYVCDVRCGVHLWFCLFGVSHSVCCMYSPNVICVFKEEHLLCFDWFVPCNCCVVTFCVLCVCAF